MFAAKIESVRSNNVSDLAHAGTCVHSVQERKPLSTQQNWTDELQFVCTRCRTAIELFLNLHLAGVPFVTQKCRGLGTYTASFPSALRPAGKNSLIDDRSCLMGRQVLATTTGFQYSSTWLFGDFNFSAEMNRTTREF